MTNTISTVFTTLTSGVTDAVDAYMGVAILIMAGLCALALGAKFIPKKKKIV